MKTRLVLASGSAIRAQILDQAGLTFTVIKPNVDEDALKAKGAERGENLEKIAQNLADAKALAVPGNAYQYILGSDQILEFEERGFDKPQSLQEAGERLKLMSGKRHTLINAVTITKDNEIIYQHIDRPKLFLRELSDLEIAAYLKAAGTSILSSVGAYQVEKFGARLFDRVEGDYFAILGLSIFPVLKFLRDEQVIDF